MAIVPPELAQLTAGYADELTPETPAIELCDRLIRADANRLFCGRSGRAFECWVPPSQLHSTVTTLDGPIVHDLVCNLQNLELLNLGSYQPPFQ